VESFDTGLIPRGTVPVESKEGDCVEIDIGVPLPSRYNHRMRNLRTSLWQQSSDEPVQRNALDKVAEIMPNLKST